MAKWAILAKSNNAIRRDLTFFYGHSSKGSVKVTRLLVGEGRLLDVDLGTVNLAVGVRRHGNLGV